MKNTLQLFFFLLVLTTFLFLQSCSEKETPTQTVTTGTIQGKVTDAISGTAINNASVVTNPPTSSVLTDQNGEFTISDVPAGTYTVTASKIGSEDCSVTVSVVAGKTTTANMQMNTAPAPNAPLLSSPANGATNISNPPTLVWNASSGATSYTLQVSGDSSFTSLLFNQSGLTGTSQQVTGLGTTTYYWRVNASNSYSTSGWSSPIWNFTTVFVCGSQIEYAGKTYNTVLIGSQCWLKENLDVGTMIQGSQNQTNNGVIEKYCYDNDTINCNTYGGLYQWNEAMQYSTTPGTQGICPDGWHIPTDDEWCTLTKFIDSTVNCNATGWSGTDCGTKMKSTEGWSGGGNGTNTSGFTALAGGHRDNIGNFVNKNSHAGFWSSSEQFASDSWIRNLYFGLTTIDRNAVVKVDGRSIRCVKD